VDEAPHTHLEERERLTMNTFMEDLARAQIATRLSDAHELRRGRQHAAARRLSRKAEQAARQARLALARGC
jgi:hypothetical protein